MVSEVIRTIRRREQFEKDRLKKLNERNNYSELDKLEISLQELNHRIKNVEYDLKNSLKGSDIGQKKLNIMKNEKIILENKIWEMKNGN